MRQYVWPSFKKGDLKDLRGYTLLIAEPHLDNRTAAVLRNLPHRDFAGEVLCRPEIASNFRQPIFVRNPRRKPELLLP